MTTENLTLLLGSVYSRALKSHDQAPPKFVSDKYTVAMYIATYYKMVHDNVIYYLRQHI